MTAKEFRAALLKLKLNQSSAAVMFGKSLRTIHGYANGGNIPEPIARLLAMYLKHGLPKQEK